MKKLFIIGSTLFLILNVEAAQRGAAGTPHAGAGRDVASKEVDEDPISMEAMTSNSKTSLTEPRGFWPFEPTINIKTNEFIDRALSEPEFFRHAKVFELTGKVDPSKFSSLARALEQFSQLECLVLAGSLIGNAELEIMIPAFMNLPNLQRLRFTTNNITSAAGAALKDILGDRVKIYGVSTSLAPEELIIDPYLFQTFKRDLDFFLHVKKLKIVEFPDFRAMSFDNIDSLINLLSKLNKLENLELMIETSIFPVASIPLLTEALGKLTKLKTLKIKNIAIRPSRAGELSHALSQLPHLERLELINTRLEAEGAEILLTTLNNLPHLMYLNFKSNGLSEVAIANFRSQLKRSITLEGTA